MDSVLYCMPEEIKSKEYVTATYYIKLNKKIDILKKAEMLAVGQTIGTWVPIPGITEEIREKYMGKVIRVYDVPSLDLSTQEAEEDRAYLIQIAYPAVNFGGELPLLLTSLLGNDASTSAQVKLLNIELPQGYAGAFKGPGFGIEGVRKHLGVDGRPILLNMIKPCTGLTPEAGAKIFYQAALGGADIIKDDELLGNPSYSRPEDRVRAYKEAAEAVYQKTGHRARYFVNATCGVKDMSDTIKRCEEAGADGIMLNFAILGYSVLNEAAGIVNVPILGHCAGAGMYYEGIQNGMASPLAVGKLARLSGADIVMVNTPYGGYPMQHQKYIQTIGELVLPLYHLKPSMPSIGGGVHPGMAAKYYQEVGCDMVLAAGGAVQGHPDGITAGARAMRQAIDAAVQGESLERAAKSHHELSTALDKWGIFE